MKKPATKKKVVRAANAARRAKKKVAAKRFVNQKLVEKSAKSAAKSEKSTKIDPIAAAREEKARRASVVADEKPQKEVKRADVKEAEAELVRRELARRRLLYFIRAQQPNYKAGWIHEDICRRLENFLAAIERGESPRLMLFMPPRHGKSLIASQYFPGFALGKHPEYEIIAASYSLSLPINFSRKVRGMVRDEWYSALFPETRIDPENQNAEGWQTNAGGGYTPVGVGGSITGKGAHILIVDDPFKDAEEADSETIREKVWDWFGSTAYTRLAPNGGVLIIQTRWHDDDLSGRLINQMREALKEVEELRAQGEAELADQLESEIDRWEIVSYPAIATHDEYLTNDGRAVTMEDLEREAQTAEASNVVDFIKERARLLRKRGQALHEERFPYNRLMRIKRTLQPRHWSALYQQNPVPDEGLYFKKEMFRYEPRLDYRTLPVGIAWDIAIGEKQVNDYTVGAAFALDYDDRMHILEVVRGRWDTFAIVDAILRMENKYKKGGAGSVIVGIEQGQLEKAIRPELNREMKKRKQYLALDETLKPLTDKLVRARPLQGRMQQGMVVLPDSAPWVEMVVQELLRFPGGLHDDIVDAMAWAARMAATWATPKPPERSPIRSWRDDLQQYVAGNDGVSPMAA